ncbi:MAG: hypothetical protein IPG86_07025 [Chitinophagaceae bacterium]|nr:hypothetical protein [Chitinophagaceae bacterium]
MYDTVGLFNELHFKNELNRIMFVGYLAGKDAEVSELKSPLPELQVYWSREYLILNEQMRRLFKTEDKGLFVVPEIQKLKTDVEELVKDIIARKVSSEPFRSLSGRSFSDANNEYEYLENCFKVFADESDELMEVLKLGKPILYNPEEAGFFFTFGSCSYLHEVYIYAK